MGSSRMTSFETTITSYYQHFSKYLKDKKQVMKFLYLTLCGKWSLQITRRLSQFNFS